ncbi:hypothetical protein O3P69_016437 [Scylla paramamosain]|uniref:Uncharacterized protein n=1 Tax=Scylla paramamosain TaxID=85552 RepID=A0AAW0TD95_SCYPA
MGFGSSTQIPASPSGEVATQDWTSRPETAVWMAEHYSVGPTGVWWGYNAEINDITTTKRVKCEPFQHCSMMGKDDEIEALKRKRAVSKGKFTRKANLFTTAHGDEAPITVLQDFTLHSYSVL